MPTNRQLWIYALCNVVMLLVLCGWLYVKNQPVLPAAPEAQKKVQCVSYAPFYKKGDSPLVEGMWIKPAQIDDDLKLLSTISHCVRTYSVGQGMDYVPEAAAKLGMKVYLGAWIGWGDVDNVKEIKLATQVANTYPDTVKAMIIGNEVFLRGEQDEDGMRRYFELAKSLSKTPMTYADVWEFWIKHQKMAEYVDFQTVHILPYWENNPVAVGDAVQHAETVMATMESTFTTSILIGETGWPSVGRQRSESSPSVVNQATYIRAFIQKAQEKQWQYNIIEAVDQPWKRALEGTVGGYWGLMSSDLMSKFSLTASVSERDDDTKLFFGAVLGALILLGIAVVLKEKRVNALLGLGALGALVGINVLLQQEYLIAACRDWLEWLALGGLAVLGTLLIGLQPWVIASHCLHAKKVVAVIKLIFVFSGAMAGYLLYFDGRYRDFSILLFALPVFVMMGSMQRRPCITLINYITYAIPAALGVMFAVLCFEKELNNHAALLWLLLSALLAFASWPQHRISQSQ